jgi:DNA-binding IclR family transcriptional regulator
MPKKSLHPSMADADNAPGGAASVDRALTLLSAFREGDTSLGLADFAERTQLYKSTVLRLLASLEHAGLIQRFEDGPAKGRWALGYEVARLHRIYASSYSLDQIVLPILRELVTITGESAAYHVKQGLPPNLQRLCMYRVDSPHPVRDHIKAGDLLPMSHGTGARVLTAFDMTLTKSTNQADKVLLATIREQGYCAAVGDRLSEVAGISAPVFKTDKHGTTSIVAALTLTMPANRYDISYTKFVLACARKLSTLLSG